MGFEVDAINSVQLSNHTGYKTYYGQILNENDLCKLIISIIFCFIRYTLTNFILIKTYNFLAELMNGLVENELHHYTHLLTGYIRCPKFLQKVAEVYKMLKQKNPNLIFG